MAITRPTPLKEPIAFAVDPANIHTIPFDSQIATDPRQTSFADGLTPATMLAIAAGGLAPYGQDFNGIFKELSAHIRFIGAGGQYRFNSTLATYLGGYDAGTVLQSDDGLNAYVSTINNNTGNFNTNPALIGTDWVAWAGEAVENYPAVSQSDAETGTSTTLSSWTALRVRQAIVAYVTGGYTSANSGTDWYITLPTFLGGWKLKLGSVAFTSGTNTKTVSVTFAGSAFSATPLVFGNTDNGSGLTVEPTTRTTTGATITLSQRESSAFTSGNLLYLAIGK